MTRTVLLLLYFEHKIIIDICIDTHFHNNATQTLAIIEYSGFSAPFNQVFNGLNFQTSKIKNPDVLGCDGRVIAIKMGVVIMCANLLLSVYQVRNDYFEKNMT